MADKIQSQNLEEKEIILALPNSYTTKPNSIASYFEAMLNAEAPQRFTTRFLESLEFKSTNDRLFINVLKEMGFLDADGVPTDRYFEFLDRSKSARIVAEGVRESYSDLFAVQKNANELSTDEVFNKLRTLYKGAKKDDLIKRIASTFSYLSEYADFTVPKVDDPKHNQPKEEPDTTNSGETPLKDSSVEKNNKNISLDSLQYHINIVLPESRDQAVYDAIFKSLRDHLGTN